MKKIFKFVFIISCTIFLISCDAKDHVRMEEKLGTSVVHNVTQSNNEFGFNLIQRATTDGNDNVFLSPLSAWVALAILYSGAAGETKEEIGHLLQIAHLQEEEVYDAVTIMMNNIIKNESGIEVTLANSLWINEKVKFQESFVQRTEEYFQAQVGEVSFTDGRVAQEINQWVVDKTKGKIEQIVEPPLDPRLSAMIINALYFKGDWTYQFQQDRTEIRTFFVQEHEVEVPFMYVEEKLFYLENELFQALELPYGTGEMKMRIFLPHESLDVEEVKKQLTVENWQSWLQSFEELKGTLRLPKFKLEYETILNDLLIDLGMERAFQKGTADFSAMIEQSEPMWVDEVKQKTYIEVNEEGTEAAAVTSIGLLTESAIIEEKFYMEVNRPFLFTISDETTGVILFIGTMTQPNVTMHE